jgi:hypothetical protein
MIKIVEKGHFSLGAITSVAIRSANAASNVSELLALGRIELVSGSELRVPFTERTTTSDCMHFGRLSTVESGGNQLSVSKETAY